MPRMGSLIGMVGGLAMVCGGAVSQAMAGPVASNLPDGWRIGSARSGSVSFAVARPATDDAPDLLGMFERGSGSAFRLPVSARMSFGFGYEYLTEEDLAFEVAETGSMGSDYDSHRVMVRANWRF
jgi:hypothetical protein